VGTDGTDRDSGVDGNVTEIVDPVVDGAIRSAVVLVDEVAPGCDEPSPGVGVYCHVGSRVEIRAAEAGEGLRYLSLRGHGDERREKAEPEDQAEVPHVRFLRQ
jgi:hypothetical protein